MAPPTVQEPLRDRIGRSIYEEPGLQRDWYLLSEERREPWRKDADRIIEIITKADRCPFCCNASSNATVT